MSDRNYIYVSVLCE